MRKTPVGRWHITHMEQWDEEYCNMEVQAFVEIKRDGTGSFQFGLVIGFIDWWEGDTSEECEWTWEGSCEYDELSGSGSLRVEENGSATGEIHIYGGDSSGFAAVRAKKP